MLNLSWLHTFKTLVDVGHFTQTAEKLYMTQPGVSQHIKKLEAACDCELITREKKSFELTEQGRQVYQYAKKIAQDEAALMEGLKFDNPHSGVCSLSCSGSMALFFYPKLLELQSTYPELNINIEAAPNQKILSDIQAGNSDLGIVTHQPNSALFQSEEVGKETLCLVLPKQYQNQTITLDTLKECGLIAHPDAEHYLSMYFERCGDEQWQKADISEFPKSGYVNQVGQILLPVAKGLGFTVLPASAVVSFLGEHELHIVKPKNPVQETLYLVRKKNRQLPNRYELIESLITQHLESPSSQ
ncbi:LysR family transcriptional regulator [Vibrio sp. T187]|uniref:LysR family transcriptional regulator n=1 Tax=Vibrio TaxID=662 RepID=UPI0010C9433F|nr:MULTISPECIES: LysR family transcriptional regulator [Vibrio]MBW3695831.1 LysR family transcriptional regulator [Vibrio sp. T187]